MKTIPLFSNVLMTIAMRTIACLRTRSPSIGMRSTNRCSAKRERADFNAVAKTQTAAINIKAMIHHQLTRKSLMAFTTRVGSGSVCPCSMSGSMMRGTTKVIRKMLANVAAERTIAG